MPSAQEVAKAVWEYEWGDQWMGSMVRKTYDEVMRTDDPTGRNREMTDHDHIKWLAKEIEDVKAQAKETNDLLNKLIKAVAAPCDCAKSE